MLYMRYNIIKNFVLINYEYIMFKVQYCIIRLFGNILSNYFYYNHLISLIKNYPITKAIIKTLKEHIFVIFWLFHFLNIFNISIIIGNYYFHYNKIKAKILFIFANSLLYQNIQFFSITILILYIAQVSYLICILK